MGIALGNSFSLTGKSEAERRRAPRLDMDCRAKVHICDTGRFLAGRTRNLSASGALLEIDHPSLLVPGQRLRLGVAWSKRDVVLSADEMPQATVVRSLGMGSLQTVAITFDKAMSLPQPVAMSA